MDIFFLFFWGDIYYKILKYAARVKKKSKKSFVCKKGQRLVPDTILYTFTVWHTLR